MRFTAFILITGNPKSLSYLSLNLYRSISLPADVSKATEPMAHSVDRDKTFYGV